jgi:hypothetical protein
MCFFKPPKMPAQKVIQAKPAVGADDPKVRAASNTIRRRAAGGGGKKFNILASNDLAPNVGLATLLGIRSS